MNRPAYDEIGLNYTDFRQADPRIETRVWAALGMPAASSTSAPVPAHMSHATVR